MLAEFPLNTFFQGKGSLHQLQYKNLIDAVAKEPFAVAHLS